MINKRLIREMKSSLVFIYKNVLTQWLMLILNILMMMLIAMTLEGLLKNTLILNQMMLYLTVVIVIVALRSILSKKSVMYGYGASKEVKKVLREKILTKLNEMGSGYHQKIATSSLVQMCVEGIDQLEIYYGSYLSQFFYSMLAPLTLFIILSFVNFKVALILFICVPLIPVTIILVSKFAKKLLSKYWGQYTTLGDSFLENLEGLTTLKIYQADGYKHEKMNEEAENFRKVTMKVLTMQLNSITIMDLIAYGGAGIGMMAALFEFQSGAVSIGECILIILLSADFFIPMRTLGSLFHVAMNGIAASDKLFRFLDEKVEEDGTINDIKTDQNIYLDHVSFAYENDQNVLNDIVMEIKPHQMTSIVGESGCGKSTISSLLMKEIRANQGHIFVGDKELVHFSRKAWMKKITYLSSNALLFKGSVRENLLMAKKDATDSEMIEVLKKVKIYDFLENEQGLDTPILENGSNLSGGQCQRIAFARALLHNSEIYIFDEATSNIDVESENDLMKLVDEMKDEKTILLISHRLMNVVKSDQIYVMEKSRIIENGTHEELLKKAGTYQNLWESQKKLETLKGRSL